MQQTQPSGPVGLILGFRTLQISCWVKVLTSCIIADGSDDLRDLSAGCLLPSSVTSGCCWCDMGHARLSISCCALPVAMAGGLKAMHVMIAAEEVSLWHAGSLSSCAPGCV